jgi:erythromycin esterase
LANVIAQGMSWTFDRLPQNRSLVTWLCEHNANLQHPRKVNFYGFDVPGSPANMEAPRGHETAIAEVLRYLRRVDSESAIAFDFRFRPFLGKLQFSWNGARSGTSYACLSEDQRDELTATIADVIALIERRETAFMTVSSEEDYQWGYRAAICAQQMDHWLRQIPVGWHAADFTTPTLEQMWPAVNAANTRDRAQADNLDWIVQREGPQGRILVFADRGHLGMTALHKEVQGARVTHEVAGTYLKRRLGKRLVTIATIVGGGELGMGDHRQKIPRPSFVSLELFASRVGVPFFALDMRSAPPALRSWLNQEQRLGIPNVVCKNVPGMEFDVLLYIDTVTPAS